MLRLTSLREAVSFGGRLFCLAFAAFAADFRGVALPHRLEFSPSPDKRLIETMAGGVAAFDYDNDGFVDLFFSNGAEQPSLRKASPKYWNRLYRNNAGKGFVDVTEAAGLQGDGFSMGAAAADYDNDGFTDLFVSGVDGASRLYRNRRGAFAPVAIPAVPGWSVAAGWFDYDNDGFLDLFVVKYVAWDAAREPVCGARARTYCHPREYSATANQLLRNNRDGTFTDASALSGIGKPAGKGMSVAFGDIDADGFADAFVTNDTVPNFLFHNRGGGRGFDEIAVRAGAALNDDGRALSAMGADFRDIDNDGRDDLFYTALANETFPFLRNLGKLLFADLTYASRIGAATLTRSAWGAGIYDFDNDGRKDLFAAGGDVQTNAEAYSSRKSKQACQVLWNDGAKFRAEDVGEPALHRGAAFADFDNDGLIDIAASRLGESPVVLMNHAAAPANHWIGFRLKTLGARISIDGEQFNHATTAVGYASSSDPRVHFGLGAKSSVKEAVIRWPSGKIQKLANPKIDRYLDVAEP